MHSKTATRAIYYWRLFRDWLTCELELKKLVSTNLYAEALLNAMKKRKDTLMENNAFIAALYLDPRFNFNNTPLLSYDQKQAAVVIINIIVLIFLIFGF